MSGSGLPTVPPTPRPVWIDLGVFHALSGTASFTARYLELGAHGPLHAGLVRIEDGGKWQVFGVEMDCALHAYRTAPLTLLPNGTWRTGAVTVLQPIPEGTLYQFIELHECSI